MRPLSGRHDWGTCPFNEWAWLENVLKRCNKGRNGFQVDMSMRKNRGAKELGSGLGRTLIKEKRRERRSKKQTDGWVRVINL